jgi:hypothetical protein
MLSPVLNNYLWDVNFRCAPVEQLTPHHLERLPVSSPPVTIIPPQYTALAKTSPTGPWFQWFWLRVSLPRARIDECS